MSEWLKPSNIICAGVIGAVALWGGGEIAEYYGHRAGESARDEIEQIDIADQQFNELKRLLRNENLRDLLVENLREDGVENPMDIIEALDGTP